MLRVSSEKMRDKVFQSLEQYMTTMRELLPELSDRSKVKRIYLDKVSNLLAADIIEAGLNQEELAEAERLDRLFQSDNWIFQKGPLRRPAIKIHHDVHLHEVDYKAPGGLIRLTARTRSGVMDSVWVSGDFTAFPKEGVAELEKALIGVTLNEKSITEAVSRGLQEIGLECPGIQLEHWVEAMLRIADQLK